MIKSSLHDSKEITYLFPQNESKKRILQESAQSIADKKPDLLVEQGGLKKEAQVIHIIRSFHFLFVCLFVCLDDIF